MQTAHLSVPEQAIAAFERAYGLRVTVKDATGQLKPYLAHDRAWHRIGSCSSVKAMGYEARCVQFCDTRVHAELADHPDGRVQVCHAGFVEWVVPGIRDGQLAWILFAGVRRATRGLTATRDAQASDVRWARTARLPDAVVEDDAWAVLEGLRQLQARLALWVERPRQPASAAQAGPGLPLAHRRTRILRLVLANHRRRYALEDLARDLGLSRGRACRVVREACGLGFHGLLTRERLRTAEHLLRHTDRPLDAVAEASGFPDVSRFHRAFRAAFGMTPGAYRRTPPA